MPKETLTPEEFEAQLLGREPNGRILTGLVDQTRDTVRTNSNHESREKLDEGLRAMYDRAFDQAMEGIEDLSTEEIRERESLLVGSSPTAEEVSRHHLSIMKAFKRDSVVWCQMAANGRARILPGSENAKGFLVVTGKDKINPMRVMGLDSYAERFGIVSIYPYETTERMAAMLMLRAVEHLHARHTGRITRAETQNISTPNQALTNTVQFNMAEHMTNGKFEDAAREQLQRYGIWNLEDYGTFSDREQMYRNVEKVLCEGQEPLSKSEWMHRRGFMHMCFLRILSARSETTADERQAALCAAMDNNSSIADRSEKTIYRFYNNAINKAFEGMDSIPSEELSEEQRNIIGLRDYFHKHVEGVLNPDDGNINLQQTPGLKTYMCLITPKEDELNLPVISNAPLSFPANLIKVRRLKLSERTAALTLVAALTYAYGRGTKQFKNDDSLEEVSKFEARALVNQVTLADHMTQGAFSREVKSIAGSMTYDDFRGISHEESKENAKRLELIVYGDLEAEGITEATKRSSLFSGALLLEISRKQHPDGDPNYEQLDRNLSDLHQRGKRNIRS